MYRDQPNHVGPRMAKVYTTGGQDGKGSSERRDVEYVEMKIGPMKACELELWHLSLATLTDLAIHRSGAAL